MEKWAPWSQSMDFSQLIEAIPIQHFLFLYENIAELKIFIQHNKFNFSRYCLRMGPLRSITSYLNEAQENFCSLKAQLIS